MRHILRNPVRATYAGWDDGANRNRLLAAAEAFGPHWILSLDADERLDMSDAEALRRFLAHDALPGCAYGFRVCRMLDGAALYDRDALWAYRLFAHAPGQTFPTTRLHAPPIPTAIPRHLWLETTLRIQHFGGSTDARRQARVRKYQEADPARSYQASYTALADPPVEARQWLPRAGESVLPVMREQRRRPSDDVPYPVALSAVVISRDDEATIERAVASVVGQSVDEPFEVIVVVSGNDRTAEIVRERFPSVRLVELPRPALPGEARNAGLAVARGEYVSFPGSHIELSPGSLQARLDAHDLGYAMVTGTMLNGTRTRAGWASYFLDHSGCLPGRPSQPLAGPPAHCSYTRVALDAAGGFPEGLRAGEDTEVNVRLWKAGYRAYRAQHVRLTHHSPCASPMRLLRHHFKRGRGLGAILIRDRAGRPGLVYDGHTIRAFLVTSAMRRTRTMDRNVAQWGAGLEGEYRRCRRLAVLTTFVAQTGAWYEVIRPVRGRRVPCSAAAPWSLRIPLRRAAVARRAQRRRSRRPISTTLTA